MNVILELYQQHAAAGVAVFCLAHFASSAFGIPGGCTALNVGAGALFGFPMACAVIYPVTMLSAAAVYAFGRRFQDGAWARRAQQRLARAFERLKGADFIALVVLRFTPIIPFGLMNFACGLLRIPAPLFLASTFVGVFFDVALLAGAGAGLRTLA